MGPYRLSVLVIASLLPVLAPVALVATNAAVLLAGSVGTAAAHGGGLDANGCHNDRKRGGYHCHRAAASSNAGVPRAGADAFPNCAAARAAGAAPVLRGDPGYGPHLDRDNDGIGCE